MGDGQERPGRLNPASSSLSAPRSGTFMRVSGGDRDRPSVGTGPLRLARQGCRVAFALVVWALSICLPPETAFGAAPGAVPDLTWGRAAAADQQRTIDWLKHSGARWVRLNVEWRQAEPAAPRGEVHSYDSWTLRHYDRAVELASRAGFKIIVDAYGTPPWASESGAANAPPRDPARYAQFLGSLTERYRGRVQAYEVWNEPNLDRFWRWSPQAPAEYVSLLKPSYAAVKRADPNARVVFGGVSDNDYEYVEKAYEAGAKGHFDVMATHPYTRCGTTPPEDTGGVKPVPNDRFPAYRELHDLMVSRGDDKPIWFTELGWNTSAVVCEPGAGQWYGGVSEATQAAFLKRAFEYIESDPYVEVATWYGFRNNVWSQPRDDPEDPQARYGLLRTDFSPKPAYAAFREYALAHRAGSYGDAVRGTDGLTAFWRLDDRRGARAHDARGPHEGAYEGGAIGGAPGLLEDDPNASARFDGIDARVRVPASASLESPYALTLEAWVEPAGRGASGHIFGKPGSYYLKARGEELEFGWWDDAGRVTRPVRAVGRLKVGDRHHVAATYDGRISRLYLDGVEVASVPGRGRVRTTGSGLDIGAYEGQGGWLGAIHEPALYSRALSGAEVADHYRRGAKEPSAASTFNPSGSSSDTAISFGSLDEGTDIFGLLSRARR